MWLKLTIFGLLGSTILGLALTNINPLWQKVSINVQLNKMVDNYQSFHNTRKIDLEQSVLLQYGKTWLLIDYGFAVFYTIFLVSLCILGLSVLQERSSILVWFIMAGWFFVPITDFIENTALWFLLSGGEDSIFVNIAKVARKLKVFIPLPWVLFGFGTLILRLFRAI